MEYVRLVLNTFACSPSNCGSSWGDANTNCATKTPCPDATDAVCLATGETPLQLYYEQNVLLWVLLGPALITFGAVWARITQTNAAEKYGAEDFFVQKLGGPDAVASLRYTISSALRF